MLKEVGCGSTTPPSGDGAVGNRQIGSGERTSPEGALGCGGCGREIAERWYLRAADRAWHCGCLRCCHCRVPLAAELTCFARDGNIYCKEDYYRFVSFSHLFPYFTSFSSIKIEDINLKFNSYWVHSLPPDPHPTRYHLSARKKKPKNVNQIINIEKYSKAQN